MRTLNLEPPARPSIQAINPRICIWPRHQSEQKAAKAAPRAARTPPACGIPSYPLFTECLHVRIDGMIPDPSGGSSRRGAGSSQARARGPVLGAGGGARGGDRGPAGEGRKC